MFRQMQIKKKQSAPADPAQRSNIRSFRMPEGMEAPSETRKLRERAEIEEQYKWNISAMYGSDGE